MMKKLLLAISISMNAFASSPILEESLFYKFQTSIQKPQTTKSFAQPLTGLSTFEQKLFVDALETLVQEETPAALRTLENLNTIQFSSPEKLRLAILRIKYGSTTTLPEDLVNELSALVLNPEVDVKIIYTLGAYEDLLLAAGHTNLIELAKQHPQYSDADVRTTYSEDTFADIVLSTPVTDGFKKGAYKNSVKIFMFCRENRDYPCLMLMKDKDGNLIRNEDGTLWNHPSLASSKFGFPSNKTNGNTPAGIFTIDSVMPAADKPGAFGKFRRMILSFVPKSKDEALFKSLLPDSSKNKVWWKPSQVARDIGRGLFRIHGTGIMNEDTNSTFFPFVQTSGCVAQRENEYEGVVYKDQRVLLDKIMVAMGLEPLYANETKVKGFLFVMDLNNVEAAVTLEDLNQIGIE